LDEIIPDAPPEGEHPSATLPFRRPADYYSSPVGEARPLFPRWVPYGCGTASIILLLLVFALGAAFSSGALGGLLELMFASMQGEIDRMFTPDVNAAQKAAFDAEMKKMRDSIRTNRLTVDRVQPLLRTMREVVSDERVTPAEAEQLTREIHEINNAPARTKRR
jgi:hypothetical protein